MRGIHQESDKVEPRCNQCSKKKIQKQISEERFSTAIEAHMSDPATGALINFDD